MIKSGRYGEVLYDPAATLPVVIASINKWKLSLKTDKINEQAKSNAPKR